MPKTPREMREAIIRNLPKNTGKTLRSASRGASHWCRTESRSPL
jgi:hypothetical protein